MMIIDVEHDPTGYWTAQSDDMSVYLVDTSRDTLIRAVAEEMRRLTGQRNPRYQLRWQFHTLADTP